MIKNFLNIKNIVFIILAIIILILLPKIMGIVLLFFTAFVIAAALGPYVDKLEKKKFSRGVSTAIVVLTSMLSIFILFIPIFVIAVKEIRILVTLLPHKISLLSEFLVNFRLHGQSLKELIDINSLLGSSTDFAQNLFNQSLNFTIGFAQACIIVVALTMIVFYMLVDSKYISEKFVEFFPPDMKEKSENILSTITFKVGNYVRAQAVSMIAVGVLVMLSLIIFRIDYPFLLGLIAGILDIIPVLGPTIALAIILIVTAQFGWLKVILVAVVFLLIQQFSNYVVRPFLFGKFMKLHPLMIFFALFVAQQFIGVWGVIISPAIAATVCVLIDELYLIPINRGKNIE